MINPMTPQHHHPLHPQKWTLDLLFQNNRIHMHVQNFNTPPTHLRLRGRHKFMIS